MKKGLKVLLVISLLIGLFGLTACGGGSGGDDDLVGSWAWNMDHYYVLTFNEDGTGDRGFTDEGDMETFTWSTSGEQLRINRDDAPGDEIRNERWEYRIDGDILIIESQQEAGMIYSHIRVN